jgi:hypothetical protein
MRKRAHTRSISKRISSRSSSRPKEAFCAVGLGSNQFQKSFESIAILSNIPDIAIVSLNSITSRQVAVSTIG